MYRLCALMGGNREQWFLTTRLLVVSTVMSGILFARFPIVDYVTDTDQEKKKEGGKENFLLNSIKIREKKIKRNVEERKQQNEREKLEEKQLFKRPSVNTRLLYC